MKLIQYNSEKLSRDDFTRNTLQPSHIPIPIKCQGLW
jgi:hypothetical protein